jgi:Spy/CpxP family protein refolding chaperone
MIRGKRRMLIGALLVLVGGLAGFEVTFAVRSARAQVQPADRAAADAVLDWLLVPAGQREAIRAHDPAFGTDLKRLREESAASRAALAAALEISDATGEQIRARSESAIAAGAALERRVTEHLLAIRDHLTPEQQKRLFGLCAEGVRQGRGWQWRHGQSGEAGKGMGMGRGMGRGYRGGRGDVQPPGTTTRASDPQP